MVKFIETTFFGREIMTLIKSWLKGNLGNARRLFPVRVIVAAEASCNLSCLHCYWSHNIHEPHTSNWKSQASKIATLRVPVFYAGRVLTSRGIGLLEECYALGVKYFGIIDNGYTIFNASWKWLRRFQSINISIDGGKKAHDQQRNKQGSFDVAWKAVCRLKDQGLDPVISSAFSHMSFKGWDRFEALLARNDIPMSSTLIYATSPVRIRGKALYKDDDAVRRAFDVLRNGMPKIINIYAIEHVQALAKQFREMAWKPDDVDGDSLIAHLKNGVQVIYQPKSVQLAGEVALRWDGKFYPPTVADGEASPIPIDNLPDSYFQHIVETNQQELEVWSTIINP